MLDIQMSCCNWVSGRRTLVIIAMSALPFMVSCTQSGESDALPAKRIDTWLSNGVANGFSGAVLVHRKGRFVLNKGYGLADKDKAIPNTAETVFDIGSNTKQFTAAAILKLVQSGELRVEDSLSTFFEDLPADKKAITVHQLLTHSAGFTESIGSDFDAISREQFLREVFTSTLQFQPGSQYAYSNVGYSILARIIELVSGHEYEAFLHEHLFVPAGMEQTGYLLPVWKEKNLARGYARNVVDTGPMVTRYREDGGVTWHLKGNGGINSTQEDMYRWLKALKAQEILPAAMFEIFTTAHIETRNGSSHYGYGWSITKSDRNTKRISHNGSNGRFFHSIIWLPEDDVMIIYATNADSPPVERVAYAVERMIFDKDHRADPIEKNPYFLVFEFVNLNGPDQASQLLSLIRTERKATIEPGVLNGIGFMLIEDERLEWAVALFELNTQLFPEDGNLWDSLGEGYLAAGRKADAVRSYERALALGPEEDCRWCENSSERLKQLGK